MVVGEGRLGTGARQVLAMHPTAGPAVLSWECHWCLVPGALEALG